VRELIVRKGEWGRVYSRRIGGRAVDEIIVRDPEIMHGTQVFRGTRVPLKTLFDYLEGGETLEDFLEGFPTVSRELVLRVLEDAKDLLLARP
jgi:uncharacterized protein (DUF433 family)